MLSKLIFFSRNMFFSFNTNGTSNIFLKQIRSIYLKYHRILYPLWFCFACYASVPNFLVQFNEYKNFTIYNLSFIAIASLKCTCVFLMLGKTIFLQTVTWNRNLRLHYKIIFPDKINIAVCFFNFLNNIFSPRFKIIDIIF